jgi:alpha-1,6-mannosyltransferase
MRVVDVTSFYSSQAGGIRTYLREKSARLCARGVEVHRVVPGEVTASRRAEDGAIEHRLAGPPFPWDHHYRLFGSLSKLGALLRALAPDVIEVGSHYVLPWCVPALASPTARLVGFFHSNVPETFVAPAVSAWPAPLSTVALAAAWRLVRVMHSRYDATMCASTLVERQLREHRVPGVTRVGLGVDLARFARRTRWETQGRVCYIGRLSRDKDAALILAAAPALAAARIELVVAGAGPMAERFASCRHLTFAGAVPADGVRELLSQSDVCLVPGRYETFSFAAAEAIACGTPVVCADAGAAAELIEASGCGASFRAGDPGDFARAIMSAQGMSAAERRLRGARGHAFAQRELGWDPVVERILAVYRGEPMAESPGAELRDQARGDAEGSAPSQPIIDAPVTGLAARRSLP